VIDPSTSLWLVVGVAAVVAGAILGARSSPGRSRIATAAALGGLSRRAIGIVALAVAVTGPGCSGSDAELGRRIAAEVAKGAGTVVQMADVTDFSWQQFHTFDPYSSRGLIESRIGFEWPQADRTGIQDSDGMTLLVFVGDGAVVRHVTQPRDQGDFTGLDYPAGFTPTEAVFTVMPRGDGAFLLVPVHKPSR